MILFYMNYYNLEPYLYINNSIIIKHSLLRVERKEVNIYDIFGSLSH